MWLPGNTCAPPVKDHAEAECPPLRRRDIEIQLVFHLDRIALGRGRQRLEEPEALAHPQDMGIDGEPREPEGRHRCESARRRIPASTLLEPGGGNRFRHSW